MCRWCGSGRRAGSFLEEEGGVRASRLAKSAREDGEREDGGEAACRRVSPYKMSAMERIGLEELVLGGEGESALLAAVVAR